MSLAGDPQPAPVEQLLADVQADVLNGGIPKRNESFQFFAIQNPKEFCQTLHLETTLDLFSACGYVDNIRRYIAGTKGQNLPMLRLAIANLSFSAAGLQKMQSALPANSLGLTEKWKNFDEAFFLGMEADAQEEDASLGLKDPMDQWEEAYKGKTIDGVFLVAGSDEMSVTRLARSVESTFGKSITIARTETGAVRQGRYKGREHFGFHDNISQPTLEGFGPDNPKCPDGSVGELGGKWNTIPQSIILVQDATGAKRPKWMMNGSFLVFRKLEQHVAKWREDVEADAKRRNISPQLLAAKCMGRWFSGCPVMTSTARDDPTQDFNNQFDFNHIPRSNPMDAICPIGAHIRKMNPHRAQPHPTQGEVTKDGRIIRRGIPYGTDYDTDPDSTDRGLHFACYQSRIEYGFRVLQMNWANFTDFPGPGAGVDSMTGNTLKEETSKSFIHDDDEGKKGSDFSFQGLNPYVTPRGGEYFFTPTLSALRDTLSLGATQNNS